jgi:hypothetical protein
MPCGVWITTGVPADLVGRVKAELALDAPNNVAADLQPDGTYTVTATFDPCPPGQPQQTVAPYSG